MRWYAIFVRAFVAVWFSLLALATIMIPYTLFFSTTPDAGDGSFHSGLPLSEKLNSCVLISLFWLLGFGAWRRFESTLGVHSLFPRDHCGKKTHDDPTNG